MKKTPTIYNVTMTAADTQYSQALPTGCKEIEVSVQGGTDSNTYRLAFVTGKVETPTAPYLQFNCDERFKVEDMDLRSQTLYFACSTTSKVLQIIAWT